MDYKKIGLKCGLEIHFQLETKCKLFCKCSTKMEEKKPIKIVKRKLHTVASELGEIDVAAQYEYLRNRTFYYQVFKNETCLVELDEEPPHPVNKEALEIALQIALLLNCKIPDEIQVMRKIVIDGSNTSGFQRTMIVGIGGFIEYKDKKIGIKNVCLEEDAAAIVKEENGNVTYKLNRLGIPLVEIATETLEGFTPREIQEIAYRIGLIAKSTGKIKRGIGAIRQDVNVSIKNGERVEIKGVQKLEMLAKVIEFEVKRQLEIIKSGMKVKKETRAVNPDGSTQFTRPLPGAARMYPETDIPPILIEKNFLNKLKRKLPESLLEKLEKLNMLGLSENLANQIITSTYLPLFEKIISIKNVEPSFVASFFVSTLKDLKRRGFEIENLKEKHFLEAFNLLSKNKIVKEALPKIFEEICKNPEKSVKNVIKELDLKVISKKELKKIVKKIILENPHLEKDKLFGIVMQKVRGKAKVDDVKVIFEELLE